MLRLLSLVTAILLVHPSRGQQNGAVSFVNPGTRKQSMPKTGAMHPSYLHPKGLAPVVAPRSKGQSFNPKAKVLRQPYKGPKKSWVPDPRQKKNRPYSFKSQATPVPNGPISLGRPFPLTPRPTLAPLIPRDSKGNPITLWSPGQKINLPTPVP